MKKIKANRNVRISLYSGVYHIKKGKSLPCDDIRAEINEIENLSRNPAFNEVKEVKKKNKE